MQKSIHHQSQLKLQGLLREVRKDANLKQEEVAKKLRRPQSFVSKIESGERLLDILELRQVCHALGTTLPEFVSRLEKRLAR